MIKKLIILICLMWSASYADDFSFGHPHDSLGGTTPSARDTIRASTGDAFVCPYNGVGDSMVVHMINYGASAEWKMALYNNSTGALVDTTYHHIQSSSASIDSIFVSFVNAPTLHASTKYYATVWCGDTTSLVVAGPRWTNATNDSSYAEASPDGAWPADISGKTGTHNGFAFRIGIYAHTVAASPSQIIMIREE